jgi:hypothetical protein
VWLALSGRRRLLAYLAAWEGLLVAPTVLFVGEFFPRYALPAALPLIAAAAFGFAALWQRAKAETAALLVAVAAWGVIDIWRGERDWTKWRLLPVDRTQFVSGWPAGAASEKAAEFLEARSRERPITVVMPGVSGNPSDAVWLLLDGRPRVRLFHAVEFLRSPILRPVLPHGTVVLRRDVWTGAPPEAVRFAPQEPVFFVCPAPVSRRREGWTPTDRIVAERNPDARFVARFENPAGPEGWVESSVVLFRLR